MVSDNIDTNIDVMCTHTSGSNFPVNTQTTVTCTATDDANNMNTCSFAVVIGQYAYKMYDRNFFKKMIISS